MNYSILLLNLREFADEVNLHIAIEIIPSPALRVPDYNTVFVVEGTMIVRLVGVEVYNRQVFFSYLTFINKKTIKHEVFRSEVDRVHLIEIVFSGNQNAVCIL